jgi:hypothetical protein
MDDRWIQSYELVNLFVTKHHACSASHVCDAPIRSKIGCSASRKSNNNALLLLTIIFDIHHHTSHARGSLSCPTFEIRMGSLLFYVTASSRIDRCIRLVSKSRYHTACTPDNVTHEKLS